MVANVTPTKDQATTSDIDDLMRKVEARSRKATGWLFISVFLMLVVLVIGVVGIYKQNAFGERQAQATLEARKANLTRQTELADYVKCLSLSRFDYPPEQFKTREGTETALNKCAAKQ